MSNKAIIYVLGNNVVIVPIIDCLLRLAMIGGSLHGQPGWLNLQNNTTLFLYLLFYDLKQCHSLVLF